MKAIDYLKGIKDGLINPEKDDELLDHEVGDGNIFKLHYVNYHRIGYKKAIGLLDWPLQPFMIPEGMTREDAFKVLSYLTDFIEKNTDYEEGSLGSVQALDRALNLERFGFTRVERTEPAISLYTVAGRAKEFKKSAYYDTYFDWYTPDVTREEVLSIYDGIGREFRDIVITGTTSIKKLSL